MTSRKRKPFKTPSEEIDGKMIKTCPVASSIEISVSTKRPQKRKPATDKILYVREGDGLAATPSKITSLRTEKKHDMEFSSATKVTKSDGEKKESSTVALQATLADHSIELSEAPAKLITSQTFKSAQTQLVSAALFDIPQITSPESSDASALNALKEITVQDLPNLMSVADEMLKQQQTNLGILLDQSLKRTLVETMSSGIIDPIDQLRKQVDGILQQTLLPIIGGGGGNLTFPSDGGTTTATDTEADESFDEDVDLCDNVLCKENEVQSDTEASIGDAVKIAMQPIPSISTKDVETYLKLNLRRDKMLSPANPSSNIEQKTKESTTTGLTKTEKEISDVCERILSPNVPMSASATSMFARKRNNSTSSESPELMRVRIAESLLLLGELNKSKFCVGCKKPVEGDCQIHGNTMKLLKKTKAVETLPNTMTIQKSTIPKAGLGVFSLSIFEVGALFGPMEGEHLTQEENKVRKNNSFVWEVYDNDRVSISHYLDCVDQDGSNWMRFINCARFEEEQNLIAEQYDKKIFFKAYKKILPGDELLVWYGNAFGSVLQSLLSLDIVEEEHTTGNSETTKDEEKATNDIAGRDVDGKLLNADNQVLSEFFDCPMCQSIFSSAYYLDRHRTYACPESTEFRCEDCSKLFKNMANFKRHQQRGCELKKAFKCIICSATFTQKANLKVHLKTHLNIREFKCPYCDRHFSRNTFLKNHVMSVHEKEKPFVCSDCGKTFSRMDSMKRHAALHKETFSECGFCGMLYHTANNLNMHIRRNHTNNPDMLEDKCRICSKDFHDIKNHMFFMHQKKAMEKCSICNKSYRNLVGHMRSHNREKLKRCPICGDEFISLNGHMKKHLNIEKRNVSTDGATVVDISSEQLCSKRLVENAVDILLGKVSVPIDGSSKTDES